MALCDLHGWLEARCVWRRDRTGTGVPCRVRRVSTWPDCNVLEWGRPRRETVVGTYVNLGNEGFQGMLSYEYVDKTGLIALVNAAIGTPNKLICSTRPRRFGKTFAAEFLVAYYSQGTDSRDLFEGLSISRDPPCSGSGAACSAGYGRRRS